MKKAYTDRELLNILDDIDYDGKPCPPVIMKTNAKMCTTCDTSDNIIEDHANGINICVKCGTVVSSIFDEGSEVREYSEDGKESVSRCNFVTNPFLPQSSLGTSIAGSNKCKVRMLHCWGSMPYKERKLNDILKSIHEKCQKAGIMKCIEDDAKILMATICKYKYTSGHNKGRSLILKGVNKQSIEAACLYNACKKKMHTRNLKELSKLYDIRIKDIKKGCKMFTTMLNEMAFEYECDTISPDHFIVRFCRSLKIGTKYVSDATNIAKNIQSLTVASVHTAYSVALCSIMVVIEMNNLPLTRREVAKTFGASEMTITKVCARVLPFRNILLDNDLTKIIIGKLNAIRSTLTVSADLKNKSANLDKYFTSYKQLKYDDMQLTKKIKKVNAMYKSLTQ